jgi:Xaa-Pro aminopeptidase
MREVLKEQKEEWREHRRVYISTLQIPGEYGHGYGWPCNVGDGGQDSISPL